MTCRTDVVDGVTWRFCPDDPPVEADRLRAVVRWVTIDEITAKAADVDHVVTTSALGLSARVARDGVMGLVGNPARLYPGLDVSAVDVAVTVAAPGYVSRALVATVGPVPGFPNAFTPADLGVIAMHRAPTVLRGRVVRRVGLDGLPLSAVSVRLAGVWSTFPPSDVDPETVIEAPNLVSLHPGLYASRSVAIDGMRRRDMTLAVGEEKKLVLPATPGQTTVRASDCIGLVPGSVLAFETSRPDRVEYVPVVAVHPASTDDQPADVDLAHPLAMAHEQGTICVRATPSAPAANQSFTREGIPGDGVAFLAALGGLVEGCVVEIDGGPSTVEYQTIRLFETSSDADGFYRLPPISRVASVKLHAERFDLMPPQEPVRTPDYRRYENLVDVIFP